MYYQQFLYLSFYTVSFDYTKISYLSRSTDYQQNIFDSYATWLNVGSFSVKQTTCTSHLATCLCSDGWIYVDLIAFWAAFCLTFKGKTVICFVRFEKFDRVVVITNSTL